MDSYSGYQAVGQFFDKWITYSQARAMQNDMNEYNSPREQVARLRAAGLSPWSVNPGANQAAQPVFGESKLGDAFGSIADRQLAKRQIDIQDKIATADVSEKESQAKINETLANMNNILLKYLPESEQQRIRSQKASPSVNEKTAARYDEAIDQNIATQRSAEYLNYLNGDKVAADTERVRALLPKEIEKAESEILVNRQNVAYLKTMCRMNEKQIANLTELITKTKNEAEKIGAEAWLQKYKNRITEKTGVIPGTPAWTALSDMVTSHISSAASTRKAERKINAIGKGTEDKWQ